MKLLSLFLLYPILAVAQTPRDSNILACEHCPSAPVVQQPTKPECQRGFAVMGGGIAYEEVACDSIPLPKPQRVKLVQYRTDWKKPPIYTNKQLLKSKLFWATHAAAWTSMIIACHNPRSGEECGSESGSMAGVTALDFIAAKFMSPLYHFGAPTYAVQHYIRADLK